jgi:hypothetical protein
MRSSVTSNMNNSRLYETLIAAILVCVSAAAILMNSFRFIPDPSSDADFIARAQQKSAAVIRVSANALGPRESQPKEDLCRRPTQ